MNTSALIKEHEDNIVKCELTRLILEKELKEAVSVLEEEKRQIEMNFAQELVKKRSSLHTLRWQLLSQRRRQREEQALKLQALEEAMLPRLEALKADPSLSDHAVNEDIRLALKEIEHSQVKKYLARFSIQDCSCIGVHHSVKTSLANLGIGRADQIEEDALIDGHTLREADLNPAQVSDLLAWRNYLVAQATARCPKQLTGIQRRRIIDRWRSRKAEVQEKINKLESGFALQQQRMLNNCRELKQTTILDQLCVIRQARHEVTRLSENYKSSIDAINTKLSWLQNDFEIRLSKIAALIERESNCIQEITASNQQNGCGSEFRLPFHLYVRSGLTQFIQFCLKTTKPIREHDDGLSFTANQRQAGQSLDLVADQAPVLDHEGCHGNL